MYTVVQQPWEELSCINIFSVADIDCDNHKFCIFNNAYQTTVADSIAPLSLSVRRERLTVYPGIFTIDEILLDS